MNEVVDGASPTAGDAPAPAESRPIAVMSSAATAVAPLPSVTVKAALKMPAAV
jgi:hypothetical protein